MYHISAHTIDDWRLKARELLKRNIPPHMISWQAGQQTTLQFEEDDNTSYLSKPIVNDHPKIPGAFFSIASLSACHRNPDRWSILYGVAWRLVYEDRRLLEFNIDAQVANLLAKRKAVSRDIHKMKAFVRFQKINCREPSAKLGVLTTNTQASSSKDDTTDDEYFVAWFEPEHLIVPHACAFFIKRFHNMRWSILTPDICAHWDMNELSFTQGCGKTPTIEDELETLWLEYYANIFNPARLKIQAMQSEMPKKYWKNLPEAALIPELIRKASARSESMISDSKTPAWRKTAKSQFVKNKQKVLRAR